MSSRFACLTLIDAEIETVFDTSLDVQLHATSMARSRERAIAGVRSGIMGLDDTVTWRARHFGIWWTMTSVIAELERPSRFMDRQASGPFGLFEHGHRFVARDDGTEMVDVVVFDTPLGLLGRSFRPLIRGYLLRLIEERNAHIKGVAEARRS